jgi:oxygen-independent coproporphyrinogen-3 oxidase
VGKKSPLVYDAPVTANPKKVEHLYVHVPFCAKKCSYCAFYSEPSSAEQMRGYVGAVIRELASVAHDLAPRTIFWGGGTPSLLPTKLTEELLDAIGAAVPLDDVREWTVEVNPESVTDEKARLYRERGVNRISMGVQTLDEKLLDAVGRIHSREKAMAAYEKLRAAGFDNINLDLMFGLPGQTLEIWEETLREVIALQPEHISAYCLILEEDTEFWAAFKRGLILPNEEIETQMFLRGIEILAGAGYRQYEISNYAKAGRESQHNIAYWRGKNYYGLGPSAWSTVRGIRWMNVADTDEYVTQIQSDGAGVPPVLVDECTGETPAPPFVSLRENVEELTPLTLACERAAFGLRMLEGLDLGQFRRETGFDLEQVWAEEIDGLIGEGLLMRRNNRVRLTKRGVLFADTVAESFVGKSELAARNRSE